MDEKKDQKDDKEKDPTHGPGVRGSASQKDEGDQALIRQQRAEQRGNGTPAPAAGGVTRNPEPER